MFRKLFFLTAGIFLLAMPVLTHAGDGPTQVTIAGNVNQANRGAIDKFTDAFLAYHDKTFSKAMELDLDALMALKQVRITADAEVWKGPMNLQGPGLDDVLAAAGVTDKAIVVKALDGYEIELSPSDIKEHQWVLALQANDKPLAIGGRGPMWLAYDTGGKKASTDEESKWVFSVFFLEVR
jgi:hypothetical protein